MRFAVGYPLHRSPEPFADLVADYRDAVQEVYFAWPGLASGRSAGGRRRGAVDWTAQDRLEQDLRRLKKLGVALDLLFNANCYGERALSEHLQNEIGSTLDYLAGIGCAADIITTTSPFVAHVVKTHFPDTEVRASVNMRIATPEAMAHLVDLFDSFYLCRDRQRNLETVREVRAWCDEAGKGLCLLANSGCLRHCPAQTFHDNLVAHDAGVDETRNVTDWNPHLCRRRLADRAHWPAVLQATWIRPEDVHHYDGIVDVMKLATRLHDRPRAVLEAYASGRWRGNLLDLLEPGFARDLAPWRIDNDRFPDDWFAVTSTCDGACRRCGYCAGTLERVLQRGGDAMEV